MKRICSVFLVLCMCLCMAVASAAGSDMDSAVFEVTSLGIFEGDENGDLKLENTMTRAEFAKVVVVLSGLKDVISSGASPMKDVPADHWASGYIEYLVNTDVMNGYPDGTFRPDATITLDECLKTILVVMGYEIVAEGRGGYPDGYYSVAVQKELVKGVVGGRKNPALRKDIIMVIYRALDVPFIVNTVSNNVEYYEDPDTTIRQNINRLDDLDSVTGIVSATSDVWLNAPNSSMEIGQIEIDGLLYDVSPAILDAAKKFIGQKVVAYYKYDDSMAYPVIHNIQSTVHNSVTEVRVEDMNHFNDNEIQYTDPETGRKLTVNFESETRFVYNGRPETRLTDAYKNIERGSYILVSNDYDKNPEYVFAEAYSNYVIEKPNINGNLKLKYYGDVDGEAQILLKNILLDLKEDNEFTIKNAYGKSIPYTDLQEGMVISVYENNNDNFRKIIVSDKEVFTAKISGKESSDNKVIIDDSVYVMDSSVMYYAVKMSEYYNFYLDAEGRIAFFEESTEDSLWKFGYIFDFGNGGFGGNYEVMMIDAGKVINRAEQNLEDRTDTSSIPVTLCQNDAVVYLAVAEKVSVNGRNISADEIESVVGIPIRYALNADGQLRKIEELEEIGGSVATKYNAKEKVFGTVNVLEQRPFMIDSDTKAICLPSNSGAGEEDLLVQISIDNKDTYMQYHAFGYEQNEETNAAKLLVITQEMKADKIKQVVPSQAKVALVSDVKHAFDSDDTEYLKITLITGSEVKTMESLPVDERPAIKNLKAGDFVFFSEDANGKFDNAKIINNVRNAINGEQGTTSSDYSQSIGYVQDIRMNQIDNVQRIRINQIDLITLDGLEIINIPISNYPDVFIYDMENDSVTAGDIDDIVPYSVPVEDPEKIVVLYSGETIRSIIIMR